MSMSPLLRARRETRRDGRIDATGASPGAVGVGSASWLAWCVSCSRRSAACTPSGSGLRSGACVPACCRSAPARPGRRIGGCTALARTTNAPTRRADDRHERQIDDPETEAVRALAGARHFASARAEAGSARAEVGPESHPRPCFLLVQIELGRRQADAVEDPRSGRRRDLLAHDRRVRDRLDRVLVPQDQVVSRDVCLAEDLRREPALVAVAESTLAIGFSANGPPPLVRFMIWSPIFSKRLQDALRASSSVSSSQRRHDERLRAHRRARRPSRPPARSRDCTSPPTPFEFSP